MIAKNMKRITMSVDDELASQFEAWVKREGYENRSEAFRDLVRHKLDATSIAEGNARNCVATVSYIYNHHERHLANAVTRSVGPRSINVSMQSLWSRCACIADSVRS